MENNSNCDCPCEIVDTAAIDKEWRELSAIWPSSDMVVNNTKPGKLKMNGGQRGGGDNIISSFVPPGSSSARLVPILKTARSIQALGDGSFGTVDLVQFSNGRTAVRKTIRYEIRNCYLSNLVKREINVFSDLTIHPVSSQYIPNLIGAIFYQEDPGTLEKIFCCKKPVYRRAEIFMDFIKGEVLHSIIKKATEGRRSILSIEFVNNLIPALYRAVRAIHAAGYVHSDIKPENILINEDYEPILIDFGSTVRIGHAFEFGTYNYLPPHIQNATDKVPIDPDIDIYALEKAIYNMRTILRSFTLDQGRYRHPNNARATKHVRNFITRYFGFQQMAPPNYVWQNATPPHGFGNTVYRYNTIGAAAGAGGAAGAGAGGAAAAGEAVMPINRVNRTLRRRAKSKSN
jgi:serine/threonine protein kinase